jgi:hypothetical protein
MEHHFCRRIEDLCLLRVLLLALVPQAEYGLGFAGKMSSQNEAGVGRPMLPLQMGVPAPVTPVQPSGLTVGAPDSLGNTMMTPPSRHSAGLPAWSVGFNPLSQMWEAAALPAAAEDVPETSTPQQKSDRPATQPGDGSAHTPAPTSAEEHYLSPLSLKLIEMVPAKQVRVGAKALLSFPCINLQTHASIAVDLSLHIG